MTPAELLENLRQDLGNINASRQAHQQILQILNAYQQKINDTPKADADLQDA